MQSFKPARYIFLMLLSLLVVHTAQARNSLLTFPAQEAIERGISEGVLNGEVKFYFAGQAHPKVIKKMGEFKTNKKTNAFNKSDERACEWAFFSALKSLQQRAQSLGANAVINIMSNYKSQEFSSPTEFQCGAGNVIAGVALKGTVAKIQ